jgi:uncharacterized protein (DUF58 family)
MPNSQRLLDPEMLARLTGFPLRSRLAMEGYVSGVHRSRSRGVSVEFAEHREYAPGDDLRYLDWKALGRTDKYYLKQFEEETNLACYLLLDASESMSYRGPAAAMSKFEYAQRAAAAMAYLVLHQQDCVGLATFDSQVRAILRPSGNPAHLQDLLRTIDEAAPKRKTSLGPILHDLAERLRRRGIVIVLSDMFDDVAAVLAGLKHLRHRRHEVILMHVLDSAEIEFPFDQATLFVGLEEAARVPADPPALRRAYLAEFAAYLRQLRAGCREQAIDYLLLRTDRPLGIVLSNYLASRG